MGEKKKEAPKAKPTVWFSLKNSLHCKSGPSDVHDPTARNQLNSILTKKAGRRSGCSRSISNLKDVIHGSKRHMEKPAICSPRSIGSSDFLNPIAHEVILNDSNCELKITGFGGGGGGGDGGGGGGDGGGGGGGGSTFVGTLRPGTPGPGGQHSRKSSHLFAEREGFGISSQRRGSFDQKNSNGGNGVICPKCGEQFVKREALESHHLSKHAVTELIEGDSSRKIVEIICKSSWMKSETQSVRIDRVLKVHNMGKTVARFEEYRETVKIKASKLSKKHPRCLADGNELLRFYGTTLACPLGINASSSLCVSDKCCVCRIIRNGFTTKREFRDGVGVFTTSTSGRAFDCIKVDQNDDPSIRRALIVCRVVAGRVHRPLENVQEIVSQTGFDSLAGKVGLYSNIEELYLLNPKALLPCFVVICK